jgi:hypothetical protein
MPVSIVFESFEVGATIDEIMEWFHLTREQIVTVLEFAARSLDPFSPPGRLSWICSDRSEQPDGRQTIQGSQGMALRHWP